MTCSSLLNKDAAAGVSLLRRRSPQGPGRRTEAMAKFNTLKDTLQIADEYFGYVELYARLARDFVSVGDLPGANYAQQSLVAYVRAAQRELVAAMDISIEAKEQAGIDAVAGQGDEVSADDDWWK